MVDLHMKLIYNFQNIEYLFNTPPWFIPTRGVLTKMNNKEETVVAYMKFRNHPTLLYI